MGNGSSLKQLYPAYLAHNLVFWVTCGVKMMSLHHGWGWLPPQSLLSTSPLDINKVFKSIDILSMGIWQFLKQVYPQYLAHNLVFWVTCGVKMMWLCHGWGCQPIQTASCIHIRHIQSVWAHWCAVHGHIAVASNSYTHTGNLGHLCSHNDVITSWLRLTATSNCFPHPH